MTAVTATDGLTSAPALTPPSSAGRARWVIILLWMEALAATVIALLALVAGLRGTDATMEVFHARGDGNLDFDPVATLYLLVAILKLLGFVACAIAYFLWVYRARVRQRWFSRHLGFSDARGGISPTYSILVWFIPVLGIVLPYNDVHDLLTSEPSEPDDRRLLLPLWWGSFVVSNLMAMVSTRLPDLEENPWLTTLENVLVACSAVLAARWIGEFERRTARRTTTHAETATPAVILG